MFLSVRLQLELRFPAVPRLARQNGYNLFFKNLLRRAIIPRTGILLFWAEKTA